MKKALLASSAIVGASLLAAPVSAGTVGSADNMSVTLGGIYWFQMSFLDEDVSAGFGRGYRFQAPESEVFVKASNKADNGIEYGVTLELEAGTNTTGTDEAYAHVSSDAWGLVQMGDNDGAANQMYIGSGLTNKSAGGTIGGLAALGPVFHSQHPGLLSRSDWQSVPGIGMTSDATKVTYFTPRFAGFQLGASLTPDTGSNGASFGETDNDGDFENVVSAGINYVGKFDDVGISLGATGEWGEGESSSGSAAAAEDLAIWQVGAKVDFAGFSVGADYRDNGDSVLSTAATSAGADAGSWWSLGAGYTMGPWGISAHYALGEADTTTASTDTSVERYGIGVGYSVAPGWRVTGDLMRINHENPTSASTGAVTSTTDNESTAFFITNFFSF